MLSFQIRFLKSWKTAQIGRDVEDTLKRPWQPGNVRDEQQTAWVKGHYIALSRLGKPVTLPFWNFACIPRLYRAG